MHRFYAPLLMFSVLVPSTLFAELPSNEQPYPADLYAQCFDGIDNDGDGNIDLNDVDCPICNDGQDNDGDGLVDLADPDCPEFWAHQTLDPTQINRGYNTSLRASALDAFAAISTREGTETKQQTVPTSIQTTNTYAGQLAYSEYPESDSLDYEDYPRERRSVSYSTGVSSKRAPSAKRAPGYSAAPNYAYAPAYTQAPQYLSAPTQATAPGYTDLPQYQTAPDHIAAPTYETAPGYNDAPASQPAPGYTSAPDYQPASTYKTLPDYQPSQTYEAAPNYTNAPQYTNNPGYTNNTSVYTKAKQPQYPVYPNGSAYATYPTAY